jgi:uncharacterized protein YqeY
VAIVDRIQADLVQAAKARDQQRLSALRLILDSLKKASKEARGTLSEEDEVAVLRREQRRRLEAAEAYRAGGREELAGGEEAESEMISGYLPEELSDQELEVLVNDAVGETGAESVKEMGKVMAAIMPKLGGRADGKRVSTLVRERLSG